MHRVRNKAETVQEVQNELAVEETVAGMDSIQS
jgi:hypothetical protein